MSTVNAASFVSKLLDHRAVLIVVVFENLLLGRLYNVTIIIKFHIMKMQQTNNCAVYNK